VTTLATIRRCLPEEADRLTEIAHAAKRHWGYAERHIQGWRDDLTVTPAFVAGHDVHAAVLDGRLLGFYALAARDSHMEMEHFWVDPPWIGRGIGRALFEHGVRRARAVGSRRIEISSDPNARGFYERMGARVTGRVPAPLDGRARYLPRLALDVEES
jgi:GNAT superfamily N-acetyltransferase